MSAALAILPTVWAFAVTERKGPARLVMQGASALATAAGGLRELALAVAPEPLDVMQVFVPKTLTDGLAFYRKYTEGLLRRYVKLSLEAGRTPSLLGKEMFRGKVTSYGVASFEDVVIFVCDVGHCLDRLDRGQRHLVRTIALQEYTQGETAEMMGLSIRTVCRRYGEAIDRMTAFFLERGLLEPLSACQGVQSDVGEVC